LCCTKYYGIYYQGRLGTDRVLEIHGFVDVDWDGYLDHIIFTSGYVFNLFGGAMNWMSKRQYVVSLSTIEVKNMATTHAHKEVVWLQRLFSCIIFVQQVVRLDCDSCNAIFIENNLSYHFKTKHIDLQYHFVRDMVEDNKLLFVKVDTLNNVTDSLTNSMSTKKFSWCREIMGIVSLDCLSCNLAPPRVNKITTQRILVMCYILFTISSCTLHQNERKVDRGGEGGGYIF
jgi:hypothetical protein